MVVILLCFLTVGCATTNTTTTNGQSSGQSFANWDFKNYEATKDLAKSLLKTWRLNSGFIRGALGAKFQALPSEVVRAMDELDEMAQKPIDELDDMELGYSLGVRVLMAGEIVLKAIERYSPEVLPIVLKILGIFS